MTEQSTVSASIRDNFKLDNPRGQAAVASALLFLVAPSLAVFVSTWYLLLLVPAALLSAVGFGGGSSTSRWRSTGVVMTFNGVTLMVALFVVGFITDFILNGRGPHETEAVAFGFTTVHIMLGVGLMLVDHYRHVRQDA